MTVIFNRDVFKFLLKKRSAQNITLFQRDLHTSTFHLLLQAQRKILQQQAEIDVSVYMYMWISGTDEIPEWMF